MPENNFTLQHLRAGSHWTRFAVKNETWVSGRK